MKIPKGGQGIPNWFYYWKQTSAVTTSANLIYNPDLDPYGRYVEWTDIIQIGPNASGSDLSGGDIGICRRSYEPRCGDVMEGIDLFALTIRHETQHYFIFSNKLSDPDCNLLGWFTCDNDGDGIANNFEAVIGSNPNNPDTENPDRGFWRDRTDDNESFAYCKECEWMAGLADSEDWSEGGHQW